ncbi:MAG: M24 family metallopeptidase [Parachlamydiaceae bacterium]
MNDCARLERLRILLKTLPCDALLIEHPIDLLYLTGIELSAGQLIVSEENATLIVDGRYYTRCCTQTLYPVEPLEENSLKNWMIDSQIDRLGFDQSQTTYQRFLNLVQLFKSDNFPLRTIEVIPIQSPIQTLRLIKDSDEITALRRAAHLGCQGYAFVLSLLKEGIEESELAFELEFFWKKRGGSRLAFDSIIAFGANGAMPHHRAGSSKLMLNTSVLIDIGVVLDHYHSDMTRVIFFGEPLPIIKTIYSIVEEAKERALALCRPGTLIGDVDRIAREWIASNGYGELFLHSLGHGIGLDIHEAPLVRDTGAYRNIPLAPGMVITIEPGIYLPQIGGVRLEDTILITDNGYENLTLAGFQPQIVI